MRSEQTANGARIVFTPENAADLNALLNELRADADIMARVHMCPMLSDVRQYWQQASAPTVEPDQSGM